MNFGKNCSLLKCKKLVQRSITNYIKHNFIFAFTCNVTSSSFFKNGIARHVFYSYLGVFVCSKLYYIDNINSVLYVDNIDI